MSHPNTLDHFWLPFTPNRAFRDVPRMIVSADGMYYTSADGRQILDGTAGLWCVNAGHNHPIIADAIRAQVSELDYAPCFNFAHPKVFELSSKLAAQFPEPLNQVFYTNSGSESVDTALKIALAYQAARGEGTRTRLIGRERGYHGTGFGGISVGGITRNRMRFGGMLTGVDHLRHTHDPDRNAYVRGCPEHGAELADDLQRLVELHGPSTIAAVIVEPMAGSAGVLPPPRGYLQRLRALCDQHDILLIFDEVITAFGRLGKATAADHLGVTPDIICCAKGLTSGTIPMGAVVASDAIYETITEASDTPIELFHGYTYSGHPMATAAALATLKAYETDHMYENAMAMAAPFENAIHGLRDCPHVTDIRNLGLAAAIDLAPRPGALGARATEAMKAAWEQGAMIRITGDTIALSPPLIVNEDQISDLSNIVRMALNGLD